MLRLTDYAGRLALRMTQIVYFFFFFTVTSADDRSCSFSFQSFDYNISSLRLLAVRPNSVFGFAYIAAICGPPLVASDVNVKLKMSLRCAVPKSAVAFQMGRQCIALAKSSSKHELNQNSNNSLGVTILLNGGEPCAHTPRSLLLSLECTDTWEPPTAGESTECNYWMRVRSPAACPLQCRRDLEGEVCGGKGRGYCKHTFGDKTGNSATCVCAPGYKGPLCQPSPIGLNVSLILRALFFFVCFFSAIFVRLGRFFLTTTCFLFFVFVSFTFQHQQLLLQPLQIVLSRRSRNTSTPLLVPYSNRCEAQRAALSFKESSCPSSDVFTALYDAAFACVPSTILNVGANKGYFVAEILSIFAPFAGVTPFALGNAIAASNRAVSEHISCGVCDDCNNIPPPSAASSCSNWNNVSISIYAFEPVADNFRFLQEQLAPLIKDEFASNIHLNLHRVAVVQNQTETPSVLFTECKGGSEICHIVSSIKAASDLIYNVSVVSTVSLDSFCISHNLGTVDLLLIDAEGFDPSVLRGASKILAAGQVRALVFEYNTMNNWQIEELGDILTFLDNHGGFDCWMLQQGYVVLLSGCWKSDMGKEWSNVLCVRRLEYAMHAVLMNLMP